MPTETNYHTRAHSLISIVDLLPGIITYTAYTTGFTRIIPAETVIKTKLDTRSCTVEREKKEDDLGPIKIGNRARARITCTDKIS